MNKNFLCFNIPTNAHNDNGTSELTIDIVPYFGGFRKNMEKVFTLDKNPWVPQKNDKIYFLPGVNIPRIKFKNLALEHNIKTVREPSVATVVIGSKASLYKMTDNNWTNTCSTADFKAFWEVVKHRFDDLYVEKVESSLEYYTNENVLVGYNTARHIINNCPGVDYHSDNFLYVLPEYVNAYTDVESLHIYDENCVISLLNGEDATEINEEVFNKLSDMLNSTDTDNHILAMEIMANSKYIESLIYTELLFYKFANVFFSTHTKNHVNFKSLTSYLNKSSYFTTTIDDIVLSLQDKGQFDTKNLDILLNYCHKDILRNGETSQFTIKTISLTDSNLEKLDTNYTYPVQQDYVSTTPVLEEEVVEEKLGMVFEKPVSQESIIKDMIKISSEMCLNYEMDSIEEAVSEGVQEPQAQEEEEVLTVNNNTNGNSNIDWF